MTTLISLAARESPKPACSRGGLTLNFGNCPIAQAIRRDGGRETIRSSGGCRFPPAKLFEACSPSGVRRQPGPLGQWHHRKPLSAKLTCETAEAYPSFDMTKDGCTMRPLEPPVSKRSY